MEIFGIPLQAFFGQLLIGLINGSFYALLSLGLAVIFGLLNIINFTHGAQYMLGAFVAYLSLSFLGLNYWVSLILTPILVGASGIVIERTMLKQLYKLDHLYGLLLTFGLALIIQGLFRHEFGSSGMPYPVPEIFQGSFNTGFMFLPKYRAWVIVVSVIVCLSTWYVIERTKLGAYLRAATENPSLVQAFGINVPRMITLTYGFGVGLAALAGIGGHWRADRCCTDTAAWLRRIAQRRTGGGGRYAGLSGRDRHAFLRAMAGLVGGKPAAGYGSAGFTAEAFLKRAMN